MTLYQKKYRVETTRLPGYDYSQNGFYFVTGCVKNRKYLLGKIIGGAMKLNEFGKIVNDCWFDLPNHYSNIKLDAFQIMPNHFHCIVEIDNGCFGKKSVGYGDGNGLVNMMVNDKTVFVETGLKPVSTTTTTIPTTTTMPTTTNKPIVSSIPIIPNKPPSSKFIKHHGLFEFMRALNTFSARKINVLRNTPGQTVWQSRFHDHIIRDIESLYRIRNYIFNNPKSWNEDIFYN